MRPKVRFHALAVLFVVALSFGYAILNSSESKEHDSSWKVPFSNTKTDVSAFSPLPQAPAENADKVALGRALFFDKRLSADHSISCATCHAPERGGSDRIRFSVGIRGSVGEVNAPTVLNSSLNFRQFWNGRAHSLEEQADGPVQNPKEMGADWKVVARELQKDSAINAQFQKIYGKPPGQESIVDAIASFERTLITYDSPFDRYLNGDRDALGASQIRGFKKFKSFGCSACHQGANLGGNMYQKFGIVGDYFKDRGGAYASDDGRFQVTGKESDRHVFRVPSLRNVELTPPYFHDGSIDKLEDAVKTMAKYQLGRNLPDEDSRDIAEFLRSLTGKVPAHFKEPTQP